MVFGSLLYYLSESAKKRLRRFVSVSPIKPAYFMRLSPFRRCAWLGLSLCFALLSGACTVGSPAGPEEFNDPYETTNRAVHNFNKAVDRGLYRPVSTAYGVVIPAPIRQIVLNFSDTVDTPRRVVNDVLQGEFEDAGHNAFRFGVNVTMGLLGLFDPASGLGLEERESDFGETLHVWGVGEGAYLAVPLFGPSTQRDLAGDIVDLFTNPLSYALRPPESYYGPAATLGENADYRYTFRETLNGVLDDSADSYAQSRQIYLQSRRFELGQAARAAGEDGAEVAEAEVIDPYEELYGD